MSRNTTKNGSGKLMQFVARIGFLVLAFATTIIPGFATAQECDPAAITVATTPVPPQRATPYKEHLRILAEPVVTSDVLLLGDSLAAYWTPALWAKSFPDLSMTDWGVTGDRTQNVLWRLSQMDTTKISPKQVVVFVGTNNLSDGEVACAVSAGVLTLLEKAHRAWPNAHIVMVKIFPRGPGFKFKEADRQAIFDNAKSYLETIGGSGLDLEQQIACAPPREIGWFDRIMSTTFGQKSDCPNFKDDLIHLTDIGYDIVAAGLKHDLQ